MIISTNAFLKTGGVIRSEAKRVSTIQATLEG